MRKISIVLSVTVLGAMILAACGGAATYTNVPNTNVPPATSAATETSVVGSATATEVPSATEAPAEGTATGAAGTPGIPVTGQANSDRLSNELHFTVLDQTGKQIGKVEDMVLDLSKAQVLYVIVNAAGKKIPVPWALLKVGTGSTSSNATGQQKNAFILQTDTDTLKNAPDFNLKNLPPMGESPDSWDIAIRKYWEGGGITSSNNTPSPVGTAATNMTATATSTSNGTNAGTGNTTSTPTSAVSAGTGQATGTGQGATSIQGVQLASKVLGAKLTVGLASLNLTTPFASSAATSVATSTPSSGTSAATSTPGTGTGVATSTPGTATAVATSTPSAGTSAATSAPSTSTGAKNLSATIDDLIVNMDSGNILYIVVKTNFDNGEHLIPAPLNLLQWDGDNQAFVLNIEAATLQSAPSFTSDQFPDLTAPGWNSEFDTFWQSNGSGNGAQATATP